MTDELTPEAVAAGPATDVLARLDTSDLGLSAGEVAAGSSRFDRLRFAPDRVVTEKANRRETRRARG